MRRIIDIDVTDNRYKDVNTIEEAIDYLEDYRIKLGFTISELNVDIDNLEIEIEKRESARKELANCTNELEQLKKEKQAIQIMLDSKQEELVDIKADIAESENNLTTSARKLNSLTDNIKRTKLNTVEAVNSELDQLNDILKREEESERTNELLNKEISDKRLQIKTVIREKSLLEAEIYELQASRANSEVKLELIRSKELQFEDNLEQIKAEYMLAANKIMQEKEKIQSDRVDFVTAHEKLLVDEKDRYAKLYKQYTNELNELIVKCDDSRDILSKLTIEKQAIAKDYKKAKQLIASLDNKKSSLSADIEGLRLRRDIVISASSQLVSKHTDAFLFSMGFLVSAVCGIAISERYSIVTIIFVIVQCYMLFGGVYNLLQIFKLKRLLEGDDAIEKNDGHGS